MKAYTVLLSIVLAASVATTAEAAKHSRHHHHHYTAVSGKASSTDWAGNPYMDLKPSQVNAFWRDAFDPFDAKW